jgi:hypothetical protein
MNSQFKVPVINNMEEIIARLKYLSNLDYWQSADDMQRVLEDIQDFLNETFPTIKEEDFS